MKIFVDIMKGTDFEIEVKPVDKISDVKKAIETLHGAHYPAAQQMLIHQGKVLKDDSTLEENNVVEKSFILIMLSKPEVSSSGAPTASAAAVPTTPASAAGGPNANPLNLFPQGMPAPGAGAGNLEDFLRNNEQFKVLRAIVQLQGNPQILEPMLQELSKEHPHLEGVIQEHQAELLRLISEPLKGKKNFREQLEDLIDHLQELRNNMMKETEQISSFP